MNIFRPQSAQQEELIAAQLKMAEKARDLIMTLRNRKHEALAILKDPNTPDTAAIRQSLAAMLECDDLASAQQLQDILAQIEELKKLGGAALLVGRRG